MPIDWNKIIQTAAVAAPGVIGGIAGAKAQSGAAKQNMEAANQAYGRAQNAISSGYGRSNALNDWMLQQLLPLIGQGQSQARGDIFNAFSNAANILSPYTGSGARAASGTNFLLRGAGAPISSFAPTFNPPPSMFPQGGVGAGPGTPGAPNVALPPGFGGNTPGGSQFNAFAQYAPSTQVKGSTAGNIAGLGGGIGGGIGGGLIGKAIGGAAGGPIGMGVGAAAGLVGNLIGHLTRAGREKQAASGEVNKFSDWFWNDVKPLYDQGKIDAGTLQKAAQDGFNTYRDWLGTTLKDKNVANNSAQSQLGYLNQGLKGLGFQVS